jgi:tetratricopeptide (TPR) repeat protein
VIGPQTRAWSWGPAMLALGIAVLAAIPAIWKRGKGQADFGMLALGAFTAAWFAWRAWISPVPEFGRADLLLLAGAVGAFVCVRAIMGNPLAERVLIWGVALLLLASVVVVGKQVMDPTFSPVFRQRAGEAMVSGFFAHYNYGANFLIASSMIVGAAAIAGRHAMVTRILMGLIAAAGLAGVWFTHSRGGILGAAVACGVFAALLLIHGKRGKAKWFGPAVIAVPVLALGIGAYLFMGWQARQELQQEAGGMGSLMDNTIRLYLLGIATQCIGLHPMAGGGSRSFSWECFRFWDASAQGSGGASPEMVHNELMQSATDYGLLGVGLLIALFVAWLLVGILRSIFEETKERTDHGNAWRIGGLAALVGVLVQSCFSFVFHLMPGALLLGIGLAFASRTSLSSTGPRSIGSRVLLSLAALGIAFPLLSMGWKGLQVTRILWPTYFSKQTATLFESRVDALTEAIAIWPSFRFHQDRATLFQEAAGSSDRLGFVEFAERAVSDYAAASRMHPYDPALEVNRANLLSQLGRDDEAESSFARAITLQGGMEAGFRSHFHLARHFYQKGLRQFGAESPEAALDSLDNAAIQMEKAVEETPPWVIGADGRSLRISIHESLGTVREAVGDPEGALEAYNFAATIPTGLRAHYRAGVLIGKRAVEAWSKRRSSEALKWFMEARRRIAQAGNELPEGVTPSQRIEYIAYLDRTIQFLKGAKVEEMK